MVLVLHMALIGLLLGDIVGELGFVVGVSYGNGGLLADVVCKGLG